MLDNQLYTLLRQRLVDVAPLRGITTAQYLLRYQPLQQGRQNERTVYMSKVTDKRYGSRQVEQEWIGGVLRRTERQAMETTIQFNVTQPVAMLDTDLTHGDVLKTIAACLQSPDTQSFMVTNGASVLRVTDIRNAYWNNDRDQNEENPSFDIVIKHNDVFVDSVPYVTAFKFNVHAVPNLA